MNSQDEAFFEQLSGAADADGADQSGYEVELARANTLSASRPRVLKTKAEEDSWADTELEGKLTVDVYQTENDIVVETAIAGVRADDIDVNATTDSVTIRGARKREKAVRDEDYLYQECYWGKFARTVILPQEVDPDAADVTFRNGILTVRLPKANRKKNKKLKIVVE